MTTSNERGLKLIYPREVEERGDTEGEWVKLMRLAITAYLDIVDAGQETAVREESKLDVERPPEPDSSTGS